MFSRGVIMVALRAFATPWRRRQFVKKSQALKGEKESPWARNQLAGAPSYSSIVLVVIVDWCQDVMMALQGMEVRLLKYCLAGMACFFQGWRDLFLVR